MSRIKQTFSKTMQENRAALVTFITAGDPDYDQSHSILNQLADYGADIIELGMPFTDPMADGDAIQKANIRALKNGQTTAKTLEMVRAFRRINQTTPLILMGYYNPIYCYGTDKFIQDTLKVGVDGVIIVDLPPEEASEFLVFSEQTDLNLIKLITPTSHDARIRKICENAQGFLYYVSVAGVTGEKSASFDSLKEKLTLIKSHTSLPVAVGFGIKTVEDVQKTVHAGADAVIVGSAIVSKMAHLSQASSKKEEHAILEFVKQLATGLYRTQSEDMKL